MTEETNAEANVSAPQVQTVALNQDEINRLKEQVRTEERAKLQSRLERAAQLEQSVEVLTAENENIRKDKNTVASNLESLRNSIKSESGSVDIPKLIEEITEKTSKQVAEKTQTEMAALSKTVATMQTENAQLKLGQYKSKRVLESRDKGDKFIAELVAGDSEEEIESSILRAKDAYTKYFAGTNVPAEPTQVSPPSNTNGPTPVVDQASQAQAHATPAATDTGKEGMQSIVAGLKTKHGKEVYAENREALLDAAAAEMNDSNLLV